MLGGKRNERIAELVKDQLSRLIQNRMNDPRIGFVTVTRVEVSPDLKYAKVHYSVLGNAKNQEATQAALSRASGFLQKELAAHIQLRFTPKLIFRFDQSVEHSVRIETILRTLEDK